MLKWLTSCHLLLHAGMWTKVTDVTECTEHVRELLQFLFNRPIYFVVHCKEENQSRNGYKQEQHPAIRHWRCTWSSKWIVKEPVVPAVVWGHCPHANVRHSSKGAHFASTSLPFFCTSQITTGRNYWDSPYLLYFFTYKWQALLKKRIHSRHCILIPKAGEEDVGWMSSHKLHCNVIT